MTTQGPFLLSLVKFPLGSRKEVVWEFPYIIQCKIVTPRGGVNFDPRGIIWTILRTSRWCYIPNMKALGLLVTDKKIFESCILKTYLLIPWPTYATNWNGLNNFGRGPPKDHSFEIWSNSHYWVKRRCRLKFSLFKAFVKLWPPGRGQFWPQGHNLNNFGRGPLDDAIYQIWKLWAIMFQKRRFLKIAFLKPMFLPRDLLIQPTGTVWTTLIGDHPGIIPVKFGQIPISG